MLNENYYYTEFETRYKQALRASEEGNIALAADEMDAALAQLEKAIGYSSGEKRTEMKNYYDRLKEVSRSMHKTVGEKGVTRPRPRAVAPLGKGADENCTANLTGDDVSSWIEMIDPDKIENGFDEILGMDDVKKRVLQFAVYPILYPDEYNYRLERNKVCYLTGAPGTGKTSFAKAVAKEVNRPFFNVRCSQLIDSKIGKTGINIDRLFEKLNEYAAREKRGIVLFLDEFDELADGDRDNATAREALPSLKRNLDGMTENNDFLVLAATNYVDNIEKAMLQRGEVFRIPLPDAKTRRMFFERYLSDLEKEFYDVLDLDKAVELSEGMSGRVIKMICDVFKRGCGDYKIERKLRGEEAVTDINFNDELLNKINAEK